MLEPQQTAHSFQQMFVLVRYPKAHYACTKYLHKEVTTCAIDRTKKNREGENTAKEEEAQTYSLVLVFLSV